MNNMFQIKHKKLKGLNSTGTFAAVNSKKIYIFLLQNKRFLLTKFNRGESF